MRVTENLLARTFLNHSSSTLARVARLQEEIASGRKVFRPSDDPLAVQKILDLKSQTGAVEAFRDNASAATAFMGVTEAALEEVSSVLSRARELLVAALNDTSDDDATAAQAEELRGLLDTLLLAANRDLGGRHVFGGGETLTPAYAKTPNGVVYRGDTGEIVQELGPGLRVALNLSGPQAFETVPSSIVGSVDLDPSVSTITPLADLRSGRGVTTGHIRITDSNGVAQEIDLLAATNLGHVIDAINNAGISVVASVAPDGQSIELTDTGGGSDFVVEDLFDGTLAQDLGIRGSWSSGSASGIDLDPIVSEATPIALILQGNGLPPGTWILRNDDPDTERRATIDPAGANTVGDLIELLEGATTTDGSSIGVRVHIDRTNLVIESKFRHTHLSVADSTGTSARSLGIAGSATAKDAFRLLEEAAAAVQARDRDAMDRMLREVVSAIDGTAGIRGSYGTRGRQVLTLAESLDRQKLDLTVRLSDVEDTDLAEAALELAQAQTVYNAALATGSRLFEQNLFTFIR